MTTSWNTNGSRTAVQDRPGQAWMQPMPQPAAGHQAPQQVPFQPAAPASFGPPQQYAQFPAGGMPPQGPGFGGYPAFPPAPKKSNTALIVSLVVAAVLLIGGGVGAFFLLTKNDAPVNPQGSTVVTTSTGISTPTNTTTPKPPVEPTTSSHGSATPTTPTKDQGATPTTPTTQESTTSDATPTGGPADLTTAQTLAEVWVDYINQSDYETAAAMVCQAQQQEFIDGFGGQQMQTELQVISLEQDGDSVVLTIGGGGTQTTSVLMWPTNTGLYLVCDGPLSEADLNWGS